MIDLAELSSTGLDNAAQQAMATQLVGYFIDGLVSDQIKMKLLRVNPPTLDEAVNSAIYEVNLRKRFSLRTTGREHFEQSGGGGWSGGAKVLGKLPVPRRPTNLAYSRTRAYCAFSRCGWGLF